MNTLQARDHTSEMTDVFICSYIKTPLTLQNNVVLHHFRHNTIVTRETWQSPPKNFYRMLFKSKAVFAFENKVKLEDKMQLKVIYFQQCIDRDIMDL